VPQDAGARSSVMQALRLQPRKDKRRLAEMHTSPLSTAILRQQAAAIFLEPAAGVGRWRRRRRGRRRYTAVLLQPAACVWRRRRRRRRRRGSTILLQPATRGRRRRRRRRWGRQIGSRLHQVASTHQRLMTIEHGLGLKCCRRRPGRGISVAGIRRTVLGARGGGGGGGGGG